MTINDCTKEELKNIIKRLTFFQGDKYRLNIILNEIEYSRIKKKLDEAERLSQVADICRQRYVEILKKNEGKNLIDIPINEIKEAEQCLKDAEKADREYNRLTKEIDGYGTKR